MTSSLKVLFALTCGGLAYQIAVEVYQIGVEVETSSSLGEILEQERL